MDSIMAPAAKPTLKALFNFVFFVCVITKISLNFFWLDKTGSNVKSFMKAKWSKATSRKAGRPVPNKRQGSVHPNTCDHSLIMGSMGKIVFQNFLR